MTDDVGSTSVDDVFVDRASEVLARLFESLTMAETLDDLCSEYIKGVRSVIPARGVGIYLSRGQGRPPRAAADGVSEYYLELYEEVGRTTDPVLKTLMETGQAVSSSDLMSAADWEASSFFREVLSIHGFHSTLKAPILARGRIVGTLNFGDRKSDAFGAAERHLSALLGRIVGLAVPMVGKLEESRKAQEQLEQAFDSSEDALVVCDLRTGSRRANAVALQILDLIGEDEAEVLLEDLFAVTRGKGGQEGHFISLNDGARRLFVRPVSRSTDRKVIVARLEIRNGDLGEVAVAPYAHALLSPREREVAAAVSLGLHDQQIADSLVLSVHTVKQHLKSIYRKLGVNSRVELTRLVLMRRDEG